MPVLHWHPFFSASRLTLGDARAGPHAGGSVIGWPHLMHSRDPVLHSDTCHYAKQAASRLSLRQLVNTSSGFIITKSRADTEKKTPWIVHGSCFEYPILRPAEGKRRKFQSSQTSEIVLDGFVSKQPVTETAGQESEIHDNGQSFGQTGKSHRLLCTVFSVSTFLTLYSSVSHTKKKKKTKKKTNCIEPTDFPQCFVIIITDRYPSFPTDCRFLRRMDMAFYVQFSAVFCALLRFSWLFWMFVFVWNVYNWRDVVG